jgi:hypothetical protein
MKAKNKYRKQKSKEAENISGSEKKQQKKQLLFDYI